MTVIAGTTQSKAAAFKKGSSGFMASEPWQTATLSFVQPEDGPVTLAVSISWLSGGSCAMFDNFSLVRTGDAPDTPDVPDDPEVITSPTEGVITHDFVAEADMKNHLLQMLADFTPYMKNNWMAIDDLNTAGEPLGVFKGENTQGNNEQGVRHSADFSMICAFLCKYAQGFG